MPVDRTPDWFEHAELIYRLQGDDFSKYIEENSLVPPALVRGPGPDKEQEIKRYHDIGTKVISYITFSNRYLNPDQPKDWRFRLADAPELCIYDEKSVRERSLFADSVDPRRLDICQNTEELVQEMLREVRCMEAGLDGIFVDHGCGVTKCYGEELGVHEHIYHDEDIEGVPEGYLRFTPGLPGPCDDALSNYSYAMLLKRAMDVMDEYGKDKIIAINSTFWPFYYSARPIKKYVMYMPKNLRIVPGIFWENCHACMVESHITVPRRFISAEDDDDVTVRWGRWEDWLRLAEIPEKYAKQGKRQLALSYYGKDDPKEYAFFSFATAKLSNLIWDVGGESGMRFCKFRLGEPMDAAMQVDGSAYYRRYERGFVVVNPSDLPTSTSVESSKVIDYFTGDALPASKDHVSVSLAPKSGRVYLQPD